MDSLTASGEDCTVDASTDAGEAAERLRSHGTLLCRQALDPRALASIRDNAQRFFDHVEYLGFNKLDMSVVKTYNCTTKRMGANILCLNARPRPPQFAILSLLRDSYLYPVVRDWLRSETPMFLFHNSRVRKVYPDYHPLSQHVRSCFPYHQDGNPVGRLLETLTCWVPLGPSGNVAPGLEIALKPMDHLLPLLDDPQSDYRDFELAEDLVESEIAEAPRWRPEMQLGDVQLIPAGSLYRTHADGTMSETGIGAELRFAASEMADRFPLEKRQIIP